MIRWTVAGIVAVGIIVAVAAFFPTGPQGGPGQVVGSTLPALVFSKVGGGTISLAAFRGKPLVVNVWATWCGPCRREFPALEKLYRANAGKLAIVAVDQGESPEVVAQFARRFGITFVVAIDEEQRLGTVLHLAGLPSSFFVDRNGVIRDAIDGEMSYEMMTEKSRRLLSE